MGKAGKAANTPARRTTLPTPPSCSPSRPRHLSCSYNDTPAEREVAGEGPGRLENLAADHIAAAAEAHDGQETARVHRVGILHTAIVTEDATSTVVGPTYHAEISADGSIVMTRMEAT